VVRAAGTDTDAVMKAKILSYSRSRGLFAGVELKGVVITPDEGDMRDVYGKEITAKEVLKEDKVAAPAAVREFPETLNRYSKRKAKAGE
jgi:SH3 domain-containing YSC84-like protein 1